MFFDFLSSAQPPSWREGKMMGKMMGDIQIDTTA
jgi:hypothetical protein